MKTSKKVLSILLAVLMLAATLAVAAVPAQAYSTIQFGNYPQSEVSETTALKNAADAAEWKSYGYYTGTGGYYSLDGSMTAKDYWKYADFFLNGVKYRAVKFTWLRPRFTDDTPSFSESYQGDNGYSRNTTYYFKYEPLTWRVLDASTGLILCDRIIDAQAFQNVVWKNGSEYYLAVNSTFYANNSTKSSISHWLNNDFYETAFNASQKNNIKTTAIHYTAYSSDYSEFNSASANRKMFLLSYDEAQNSSYGLSSASARKAKGTDYAKCQGLRVNSSTGFSDWWLRSAGWSSRSACIVESDGDLFSGDNVYSTSNGIRPACKLSNLTSDISQSGIYTINASADPSAGGTVTGAGTYGWGEAVTLTATPKYGYNFTGWYKGTALYTTNTSYSFTVSADAAYTAKFTLKNYTVTAKAGTGGSVTGNGSYTYNTSATVKATPSTGYHFTGWYNGNTLVSTDAAYTFLVTENVTLTAKFERTTYTITAKAFPANGGTVTGGGTYNEGATVTLTATPNPGYKFVEWFIVRNNQQTPVSDKATMTVKAGVDRTFYARFEPLPTYIVTATPDPAEGGTAFGGGTFTEGGTATLTATPNSGYYFIGWYEGSTNVKGIESYTFTVTKDVSLTAKFLKADKMIRLKKPTDQLNDGDWYYDADATYAAIAQSMGVSVDDLIIDGSFYEVRAEYDPDSGVLILRDPVSDDPSDSIMICPGDAGYEEYTAGVKQYHAPSNPGDNGGGQSQGKVCKYCGEVHTGFPGVLIGFFHSILALFGLHK